MPGVSSAGGGDEPGSKRRKLLDAGGPVEDGEIARQKMRDASVGEEESNGPGTNLTATGFSPGGVVEKKILIIGGCTTVGEITPMGYFAGRGDLKMMRWLYMYANGADTRDQDVGFWFPMYGAALKGHLEACKWLFDHGASKDVARRTIVTAPGHEGSNDRSPLWAIFDNGRYRDVSRWLILNGALCKDNGSGELDVDVMEKDLRRDSERSGGYVPKIMVRERKLLLEWTNDLHQTRTSFLLFLSGALARPKHAYKTRRESSPLRVLGGKSGVLQLIGDYVGILRGREARIIRQLTEILPGFNEERE